MQGKPSSSTRRLGALSPAQQRITAAFRLTALIPRQGWRSFTPREGRWRARGKPGSAARAPASPNGPQTLRHRRAARRGGGKLRGSRGSAARPGPGGSSKPQPCGVQRPAPGADPLLPPRCPGLERGAAGSGPAARDRARGSRRGREGWRAMPGGPAAGAGLARGGSNLTEEGLGRPRC